MSVTDTTTPQIAAPPAADTIREALCDPAVRSKLTSLAIYVHRLNPVDAEEAAQQVLAKLWEKCATYDPAKCSVLGWACGYLVNICREVRRHNARYQGYDATALEVAAPPSPEDTAADSRRLLDRYLKTLGQDDRDVLTMRAITGLSYSEIAAHYGTSEQAIRQRYSRAFNRLERNAKQLEGEGQS